MLEERDIPQQEIADAIGVSNVTYSRYEAGRVPDDSVMRRIAEYFGVSRSWLRYGEGDRKAGAPMYYGIDPLAEEAKVAEKKPTAKKRRRKAG